MIIADILNGHQADVHNREQGLVEAITVTWLLSVGAPAQNSAGKKRSKT